MTLFDFIDLAAELPLDAVELTSYYWAETTDAYLEKLKAHAAKKKLADLRRAGRQQLLRPQDAAEHKKQIRLVKDWTERAAKIGAKTVRIFAGSLEKGDTLADAQKRVVAAIERVLRGRREARRPARAGEPRRHHRHARAPARTGQAGQEPGAGREHRHRQLPHRRTPMPTSPRSRPMAWWRR